MTTAYTSLLGLALPVTGELSGTWGDTVNNYITSYLDAAVAGAQTISGSQTAVTLSVTTGSSLSQAGSGATGSSQYQIINCTGNPASLLTITVPAASKVYLVLNSTSTSQSVKIVGAGPTTGVTIISGEKALVAWNGSDFVKVATAGGSSTFSNVTVTGTTTLSGLTASTALALDASKNVVSVTNTGTGNNVLSASPTLTGTVGAASLTLSSLTSGRVTYAGASGLLQDSANLTFDGTTLTAANITSSGTWTFSGGTANGVLYLNGSKVATSGNSLTFDGTTLQLTNSNISERSSTTAVNGTVLGKYSFSGYDGGSYTEAAKIESQSQSSWAVVSREAGLYFSTLYNSSLGVRYQINNDGTSIWSVGGSEQMRLTSTGLGVGTSSPAVKLDVNGSVNISSGQNLTWGGAYAANIPTMYAVSGANGYFYWSPRGNTGSYMTLDANSNLGLGVTPSAWTANAKALQFAGPAIWNDNYAGSFNAGYNTYQDTNTSYKYIYSSLGAGRYDIAQNVHRWFTAPSGTAGNAISFTQAMTLDASGRLGIGITNPTNPVTVSGTSNASYISAKGIVVNHGSSSTSVVIPIGFSWSSSISTQDPYWGIGFLPQNYSAGSGDLGFYTDGSERARITSGGNFVVGDTTANRIGSGTAISVNSSTASIFEANFSAARAYFVYTTSGGTQFGEYRSQPLQFYTANTERARIDSSGNLLVGTTSFTDSSGGISLNSVRLQISSTTTASSDIAYWRNANGVVGAINISGSTTTYATSSDPRLKTLIGAVTGAGERIDALQPVEFEWKADGKRARGFFADKFQEVYPDSVTGEKDAVDAEGNPVYQSMQASTSEVIADLVAELQSLRKRVAQLEGK